MGIDCPFKITRICSVDGCGKKHEANGLCKTHDSKIRYHADTEAQRNRDKRRYYRKRLNNPEWVKAKDKTLRRKIKRSTLDFLDKLFPKQSDSVLTRYRIAVSDSNRGVGKRFSLTLEEFRGLATQPCYYCNGFFGSVRFGKGLDRIDNSRGYETGNVLPACYKCNATRSNRWSVDEAKTMIQAVIALQTV